MLSQTFRNIVYSKTIAESEDVLLLGKMGLIFSERCSSNVDYETNYGIVRMSLRAGLGSSIASDDGLYKCIIIASHGPVRFSGQYKWQRQ